jgi:preprotein translocase subunit SecG
MVVLPLLAAGFLMKVAAVLFLVCSVTLILIILIQKGKGGGLSGAFGGTTVGNILGAKSKEPMTWITIVAVGVFLFLAVILAKYYKPNVSAIDFSANQPPAGRQPQSSQPPAYPAPAETNSAAR